MLIKTKIGIKTQQIIKLQIITVGYFTTKFSFSIVHTYMKIDKTKDGSETFHEIFR